jgi:hypothetical protein
VLMAEVGDVRNACREFEKLHAERPADVEVAKMLARVRADRGIDLQAFWHCERLQKEEKEERRS